MKKKISLIVTDASPLITLAIAEELDVLLLPHIKLIIPDMVKFEVARHLDKPGAIEILDWIDEHENKDLIVGKTVEYDEFKILYKHDHNIKTRNRGEQAAAEILASELQRDTDAAILLFEDSGIRKTNFLVRLPDNVLIMSTSTFLDGLQEKQWIKCADDILDRAIRVRGREIRNRTIQATKGMEELEDSCLVHIQFTGIAPTCCPG